MSAAWAIDCIITRWSTEWRSLWEMQYFVRHGCSLTRAERGSADRNPRWQVNPNITTSDNIGLIS
jgi:hypothetical protein